MKIFTKQDQKNIAETGNVWGQTIEYDFNFTIKFMWRSFRFRRRKANSPGGRHGGGWDVMLGIEAGSWKKLLTLDCVIIGIGGSSIRIERCV